MTTSNNTTFNDADFDVDLDDIEDLPAFKNFQPGAHRCCMVMAKKFINNSPAIELSLSLIETLELSNPADTPDAPGTESSALYMMDNKFGRGNLKKVLEPIADHFGTTSLPKLIEESNSMEVIAVTKIRVNKKNPDQEYLDIVSLIVA